MGKVTFINLCINIYHTGTYVELPTSTFKDNQYSDHLTQLSALVSDAKDEVSDFFVYCT